MTLFYYGGNISLQKNMEQQLSATADGASVTGGRRELPLLLALLVSRLLLFLVFQSIIAVTLSSWARSEGYWMLSATMTNMVSILLLCYLFRRGTVNYQSLFRINRGTLRKDIMLFAVLILIIGPLVFVPGYFVSVWLWGDPAVPTEMMFRPVERWLSIILVIVFPVTIVFAELATYFGYIMPGLRTELRSGWVAVSLPVLFLSLQHITLPLIPDLRFIIYRGVVFLPFAAMIGIVLYKRPSLFPYFAVLHGIMDTGTAIMLFFEPGR
ncbi:MAG: hypothetical protein MUC78_13580 [Bacteroidales bacterium]|jgi:hypothetical protein|nr:hypothetical protein [Bacteroidales bacterium]